MKIVIGNKMWFMGSGPETEIISIDELNNSWIGRDLDGDHLYPLGKIQKHWKFKKYTMCHRNQKKI